MIRYEAITNYTGRTCKSGIINNYNLFSIGINELPSVGCLRTAMTLQYILIGSYLRLGFYILSISPLPAFELEIFLAPPV